jgi:hypothetical protein
LNESLVEALTILQARYDVDKRMDDFSKRETGEKFIGKGELELWISKQVMETFNAATKETP